jgi:hypothetical protein
VFAASVLGHNTANGIGVWARSAHGIGIFADAISADAVAISAKGLTAFSRSGKLVIAAGALSVAKTGIRIDAGTLVIATLQQFRPGVYVASATPDPVNDSFVIQLNKAVAVQTTVA